MANYTIELGELIKEYSESNLPLNERIEQGRQWLFDFNYPFYMEEERKGFETRFIRHFFTREIGFETEDLFKFKLETWLLINMSYYNQLFKSELYNLDPFLSYDLKIESTRTQNKNEEIESQKQLVDSENSNTSKHEDITNTGSNTREVENTTLESSDSTQTEDINGFNRKLLSNPADNRLQITTNNDGTGVIEYAKEIEENKQLGENTTDVESTVDRTETSNMTDEINNSTETDSTELTSRTNNITTNDEIARNENDLEVLNERRYGTIGVKTMSEMLNEYRTTFLRIERDMFKEMDSLFMQLY